MSDKAEKKKELILNTARELFSKNGFKSVTMKDIVEACGISRGGLYLYYSGTAEIFEEILKREEYTEDAADVPDEKEPSDASFSDIFGLFLEKQKKEILKTAGDLTVAKYEYYMSENLPAEKNIMKSSFDKTVDELTGLIDAGIENGEFVNDDSRITAANIMLVCEGLKAAVRTMGLSEETVNEQLSYLWGGLLV